MKQIITGATKYSWTLGYIAVVVTALLVLALAKY